MSDYVRIDGDDGGTPEPPSIAFDEQNAATYSGRLGELFPIVLLNLLLSVLTVGIYRFWGKTKIRRYLWSRISFAGQPLEYTGTGTELFLGFLIILCVLIPVSLGITALQFLVISHPLGPVVIQVIFGLLFFYLFYIAVYRAQRYRISRTTWRGIRGAMEGSSITFANRAVLYTLLTLASAGLLYPYMQVALLRYRIENTTFGRVNFDFDGNTKALMKAWIICLVVSFLIATGIIVIFLDQLTSLAGLQSQNPQMSYIANIYPYLMAVVIFFSVLPVTTIWYRAVSIRHFVGNTRFLDISAQSTLSVWNIIQIYLPIIVCAFIAISIILGLMLTPKGHEIATLLGVFFVIAYLFVPIILVHRHFLKFFECLILEGEISPEKLLQSQQAKPSTGEGLADALDIDAF